MERYGNSIFRWDASRSTTPKLGYDISYFRPVIDDALRDQDPQEEWITHACGIHNKLDFALVFLYGLQEVIHHIVDLVDPFEGISWLLSKNFGP
ncbi:uncharacterized protein LOC107840829 isoform X2 [Capsicum annuum]|uniref:uncharacterized protein LOC107840829 isoform X2 n=1 Tax=Capsicum annuum TaxID=4072 RepID=UPI0007BF991C|nr:uncharacterized protein LOC107840829 isoform X2 [Capsicum annuum]